MPNRCRLYRISINIMLHNSCCKHSSCSEILYHHRVASPQVAPSPHVLAEPDRRPFPETRSRLTISHMEVMVAVN